MARKPLIEAGTYEEKMLWRSLGWYSTMKPPLCSERTERAFLGAALVDPSVLPVVRHLVTPKHFASSTHATRTWEAILHLLDFGEEPTVQAVAALLERQGLYDPFAYASSLLDGHYSNPDTIETLADALDEARVRRQLHEAGRRAMRLAEKEQGDVRLALGRVRGYFEGLDSRCNGPQIPDLVQAAGEVRLAIQSPPEAPQALITGIPDLDRVLTLYPGQFGLIEGRTSEGKSALAEQIALANALLGRRVVLFGLEMQRWEYVLRAVAQLWALPLDGVFKHYKGLARLAPDLVALVDAAVERVGRLPFPIEDEGPWTPESILGRATRFHAYAPMDLLIIDHLGLAWYEGDDTRKEMKRFSNRIKAWAKEKGVCCVGLSQMTDTSPGSTPGRPLLGQARDCRDVEHDADWVIAPHRPGRWDPNKDERAAEICVLKQRNGWTGTLDGLVWDGGSARFLPWVSLTDELRLVY